MKYNEIVDLSGWIEKDIDVGRGTREKVVLKQSKQGKVYFFAKTYDKNIGELRSEVCASMIGRVFKFPVQRSWLCVIPQYKTFKLPLSVDIGVLIQLDVRRQRYTKRGEFRENLVHGAALIANFDDRFNDLTTNGERRNFYTLSVVVSSIRKYVAEKRGVEEIWRQFFELIVFDALIGGTDRHYYNWGVLERADDGSFVKLSPAFDNGISLLWKMKDYKKQFLDSIFDGKFISNTKSMFKKDGGGKYNLFEALTEVYKNPEYVNSGIVEGVRHKISSVPLGYLKRSLMNNVPKSSQFETSSEELLHIFEYVRLRLGILKLTLDEIIENQNKI